MNSSGAAGLDVFADSALPSRFRWRCAPERSSYVQGRLRIEPDGRTDFWQRTHYGIQADNGHFLYCEEIGDFVLAVHVLFRPAHQYDQGGLMVRVSPDCWLKTSVEFEPSGPCRLGAVVTNHGYSDWSSQDFSPVRGDVWLRVRREGEDCIVEFSAEGHEWTQMRIAHLHASAGKAVACGVYACSPRERGFVCEFESLSLARGRLADSASAS